MGLSFYFIFMYNMNKEPNILFGYNETKVAARI